MSQSHGFEPPEPEERPICSNCGWTMWVSTIEPHDDPDSVKHTFKCHRCDYEEIKIVKI
jgi:hypothetical protein